MVLIKFANFNFKHSRSNTPVRTKVEFFVTTAIDFQPLTVVRKNFTLDDEDPRTLC